MSPSPLLQPRPLLAALADYEVALVDLQRAQRRLADRADADAPVEYRRALARARELGARVRGAAGA